MDFYYLEHERRNEVWWAGGSASRRKGICLCWCCVSDIFLLYLFSSPITHLSVETAGLCLGEQGNEKTAGDSFRFTRGCRWVSCLPSRASRPVGLHVSLKVRRFPHVFNGDITFALDIESLRMMLEDVRMDEMDRPCAAEDGGQGVYSLLT